MVDLTDFKLWKQGAEGRVFLGTFLGQPAVVKERFVKKYRHSFLDEQLTQERFKSEARMILRCKAVGIKVPSIYFADYDRHQLCLQYFPGSITCKEYIQNLLSNTDQESVMQLRRLMEKIGVIIARLHECDNIHGDLTTSNFVLPEPHDELNVHVIDFGLSYVKQSAEDKSVDLYVLERAFLSSHPNTEEQFALLLKSYFDNCTRDKKEIAAKFHEVRLRGRKRVMIG